MIILSIELQGALMHQEEDLGQLTLSLRILPQALPLVRSIYGQLS